MSEDLTVVVDRLRWDRRRSPYVGRREYSRDARELLDRCARLIDAGQAVDAVPVLRKAVDRMTAGLRYLDDSSGVIGDDLRAVMALYARACAVAPPPARSLAGWLVRLAYDGPGWPDIVLADFAPALGERGLGEIGRLAEQRGAGADPEADWSTWVATRLLREQLAEVSGDVGWYVDVLAEDLRRPDRYLKIVAVLRDTGRAREALDWARLGLAEHGTRPSAGALQDAYVELLLRFDEGAAAVAERQAEFERGPTPDAFRALVQTGARAGRSGLADWAVDILRARAARQPAAAANLVRVLLAEGRPAEAWEVGSAHVDALTPSLLTELLEVRRAEGHPGDVIGHYERLVEIHLHADPNDKHRYQKAQALLPALQTAYEQHGDPDGFIGYLRGLRADNRRRPAFLRLLDAAGF
ncbi:DUF6880 family protein [Pseudofrankia asymbiotica]|uniref:DUF6880 family protein n=1 Tax=Pseudofrankia asymbiotica TaxID=1834516 RepID=UPI001F524D7C|nr:DUF6880 family protein [Pseudofrankia asymbiotica]